MATFNIADFDIYNYDIILRPDGLVQENAGEGAPHEEKLLKPYYFNTPSNFFVNPNQKCYFYLKHIEVGKHDAAEMVLPNAQQTLFLSLGVSSKYSYSNFTATGGEIVDAVLHPEHPQSAIINTPFTIFYNEDDVDSAALALGIPTLNRIVCIAPPFGQRMDFQFKYIDPHPIYDQGTTKIDFDVDLFTLGMFSAVTLSFAILVQKEPYKIKA